MIVFGYRRREELAQMFSSVKLPGGFEFTFRSQLEDALKKRDTKPTTANRESVLRRAARDATVAQGARILWVDDKPQGNLPERKLLRSLGIMIDLAHSSDEGIDALGRADVDLVISNMKRNDKGDEGERFLERVRSQEGHPPVIFYIMHPDPSKGTPNGAFGITNKPDELVHLVFDALERVRG